MSNEVKHDNKSTLGQLQGQLQLVSEARITELEGLVKSTHSEIDSYHQKADHLSYETLKAKAVARIGTVIVEWAINQTRSLQSGHYSMANNVLASYLEGRDIRHDPFERNQQLKGAVIRAYGFVITLGYSEKWESRHQDRPYTRLYIESVSHKTETVWLEVHWSRSPLSSSLCF